MNPVPGCELCHTDGGVLLLQTPRYRVVRVEHPDLPGFCRVIWQAHVAEMSDLPPTARAELMTVVFAVENALRDCYQPHKVNLASFGNVVPHLHWHILCRWQDDPWFPEPIWGQRQRAEVPPRKAVSDDVLLAGISRHLVSGACA